jgi:hypothetical protein
MLLMGDWGQQMDIEDQRKEIRRMKREMRSRARSAGADVARRLDELEAENDELKLYMAALLRYLASRGQLDVAQFRALVEAVDAQDGSADGKFSGKIV